VTSYQNNDVISK